MTAQDDALAVAMWCWPHAEWHDTEREVGLYSLNYTRLPCPAYFRYDCRDHIAAAEAVLVERGLGERYGRALRLALLIEDAALDRRGQYLTDGEIAAIRTAPLDVCLRTMAAVVRKQQEKKA